MRKIEIFNLEKLADNLYSIQIPGKNKRKEKKWLYFRTNVQRTFSCDIRCPFLNLEREDSCLYDNDSPCLYLKQELKFTDDIYPVFRKEALRYIKKLEAL